MPSKYLTPDDQRKMRGHEYNWHRAGRLLGEYGSHLPSCATYCEQTSEYCTCGLDGARKAYNRLWIMIER